MLSGFCFCHMRTGLKSGMNPVADLLKKKVSLPSPGKREAIAAISFALLRLHHSIWNMAWGGKISYV